MRSGGGRQEQRAFLEGRVLKPQSSYNRLPYKIALVQLSATLLFDVVCECSRAEGSTKSLSFVGFSVYHDQDNFSHCLVVFNGL